MYRIFTTCRFKTEGHFCADCLFVASMLTLTHAYIAMRGKRKLPDETALSAQQWTTVTVNFKECLSKDSN